MRIKLILLISLVINAFFVKAQITKNPERVKPYIAIVKTNTEKFKGLFFKIDSQTVLLYANEKYVEVKTSEIKSIKLRITKANYELQSYIFKHIGKNDPNEYKYSNQRGKAVDKWGREEPTPNEELAGVIGGAIFGTAMEGVANVLAGTLHNINPSIANYKFRKGFDFTQMETINYYSVYYQQNPNTLAELKKIKALSANFKP
ncbi:MULTISPECIES: hypothetical protein [Pedobacter]|uniref:hypothetical protein n=1 Tax=Pedobacter TaxID=84567 RepID=UPI0012037BF1|nr:MULTISPECIES: hypothetical protein [Pedobacter]RZL18376.1 MAG: hypothetical protein EOO96_27495 [Pedobacter sp.]